jgi:hypothetical protein
VLRSTGDGTNCVHHRLKAGRAMTLSGTAKKSRSRMSMRIAARSEPGGPESIDFGTRIPPTNPTAYRNAARKAR